MASFVGAFSVTGWFLVRIWGDLCASAGAGRFPVPGRVAGAGQPGGRLLTTGLGAFAATMSLQPGQVNGYPALLPRYNGRVDTVAAVHTDGGLITGLYAVRNPAKLAHLERETAVSRC